MQELTFQSDLSAPRADVWAWMTSVEGITRETRPYFRMTTPRGVRNLTDLAFQPGRRLFRSFILLGGVLPVDFSDLTLHELTPEIGFREASPMGSMKVWRHARTLSASATNPAGVVLTDHLVFEPRFATPVLRWFVARLFRHRHQVLRKHFSEPK